MTARQLLVLAGVVASALLAFACSASDETVLARDVAVNVGTTRLASKATLHARRLFNGVAFEVAADAGQAGHQWGFLLPDGTLVRPEVEVVDRDGKHHALPDVSSSSMGGRYSVTLASRELPNESEFVGVLIRSEGVFRTPKISWVSWDPK
jgi:hypothetical protein